MTCDRRRLSYYLDGELSPAEERRLRAHLAECSACREVLGQYQRIGQSLRNEPLPDLPPGFPGGVYRRIADERASPLTGLGAWLGRALPLGVVAGLMVLFAAALGPTALTGRLTRGPALPSAAGGDAAGPASGIAVASAPRLDVPVPEGTAAPTPIPAALGPPAQQEVATIAAEPSAPARSEGTTPRPGDTEAGADTAAATAPDGSDPASPPPAAGGDGVAAEPPAPAGAGDGGAADATPVTPNPADAAVATPPSALAASTPEPETIHAAASSDVAPVVAESAVQEATPLGLTPLPGSGGLQTPSPHARASSPPIVVKPGQAAGSAGDEAGAPSAEGADGGGATALHPASVFADVLGHPDLAQRLGAPRSAATDTTVLVQHFERGLMLRRGDRARIYVLDQDGQNWSSHPDLWRAGDVETSAAAGVPRRGLGVLWRDNVGIRRALGQALDAEHSGGGTIQAYQGGLLLAVGGVTYILYDDGTWTAL